MSTYSMQSSDFALEKSDYMQKPETPEDRQRRLKF